MDVTGKKKLLSLRVIQLRFCFYHRKIEYLKDTSVEKSPFIFLK